MRRLITIIFFLIIEQSAFATESFSYYIYIQTEYVQGPWIRMYILDKTGRQKYLHPKKFEELFSISGDGHDIADAILAHLRKETPERYKFICTLSISKDTVVINTKDSIEDFDAVKNEITASFILNNFSAVKIIQRNKTSLFLIKDITVPYMDLVFPTATIIEANRNLDSLQKDTLTVIKTKQLKSEPPENKISVWLIISLAINLVLTFVLLKKRK